MSAYENIDKNNIPHKVVNGEIILNKNKFSELTLIPNASLFFLENLSSCIF